jgi:hypothetical protein
MPPMSDPRKARQRDSALRPRAESGEGRMQTSVIERRRAQTTPR